MKSKNGCSEYVMKYITVVNKEAIKILTLLLIRRLSLPSHVTGAVSGGEKARQLIYRTIKCY